jgi:hypothetical protein
MNNRELKEKDIDDTPNLAPKSLFKYGGEKESEPAAAVRRNIFSWRPDFQKLRKIIIAKEKYLIAAGLAVILIFIGIGYSIIYLNDIKIRKEAVAQSLQTLPEEERDCVLDKVDVGFLERIQDPQAFSEKYYREQMELLGDCVLHKATPL